MASKYFKAFNTLKGPVTHLRNIVSSAIGKKQKTTGKTVNPFERKKMRSNRDAIMGGL